MKQQEDYVKQTIEQDEDKKMKMSDKTVEEDNLYQGQCILPCTYTGAEAHLDNYPPPEKKWWPMQAMLWKCRRNLKPPPAKYNDCFM